MKDQTQKPSEYVQKAFFDRKLFCQAWGTGWLVKSEEDSQSKNVAQSFFLQCLPVQLKQAQDFFQIWQENLVRDCNMLPSIMLGRQDGQVKPCIEEGDHVWCCYILPSENLDNRQGFINKFTSEHWRQIASALARLHAQVDAVEETEDMEAREGDNQGKSNQGNGFYWISVLQQRLAELLLYRGIIRSRGCRTDFEGLFMENFDQQYRRGQEALNNLVIALQPRHQGKFKNWALCGCATRDIVWQSGKPQFLMLWPIPASEMLDLCLLLKTAIQVSGLSEPNLQILIQTYLSEQRTDRQDWQMLQAQWLFPEGFWFYSRCYFLCRGAWDSAEAFACLGSCLLQDAHLQSFLSVIQDFHKECAQ